MPLSPRPAPMSSCWCHGTGHSSSTAQMPSYRSSRIGGLAGQEALPAIACLATLKRSSMIAQLGSIARALCDTAFGGLPCSVSGRRGAVSLHRSALLGGACPETPTARPARSRSAWGLYEPLLFPRIFRDRRLSPEKEPGSISSAQTLFLPLQRPTMISAS